MIFYNTYVDDYAIYITIGIIFSMIVYHKIVSNKKKLNNIEHKVHSIIGGINANSKILCSIVEVLTNIDSSTEDVLRNINGCTKTIYNSLLDEHDGIIKIIESIKYSIYNDDIGLLHNINLIKSSLNNDNIELIFKINNIEVVVNEIQESQKRIELLLKNSIEDNIKRE